MPQKPGFFRTLSASLFFLLFFLIISWPLAENFGSAFIAKPRSDVPVFYWNMFNFQNTFPGFYTDEVFYPKGTSMLMHTWTPLFGIAALPFENKIPVMNLIILLSFVFSGLGAFLLCYRYVPHFLAALAAGFIFAFSPYKLAHFHEHYNLILTGAMPFYILFLLRAFAWKAEQRLPLLISKKDLLLAILTGLITLLGDYICTFFLFYFTLFWFSFHFLKLENVNWRAKRTLLILGGIFIAGNILIKLLLNAHIDDKGAFWWTGKFRSLIQPPDISYFLSSPESVQKNIEGFNNPGSVENVVFLGYSLLFVILVSILALKRFVLNSNMKFFLFAGILFFMMCFPEFLFFGKSLRLPTGVFHFIPFFNNLRIPTRAILMVTLCLPVFCFFIIRQKLSLKLFSGFSASLLLILLIEYFPHKYSLADTRVPGVYLKIKEKPGKSLLTIPFGVADGFRLLGDFNTSESLAQTIHGKKLTGGYISRLKPEMFEFYNSDSIAYRLLKMIKEKDYHAPPPASGDAEHFINKFKPDLILIHPEYRNSETEKYLLEVLKNSSFRSEEHDGFLLLERF